MALGANPRRDARRRPPGRPRQLASPPPESPGTTPQWPSVGFGSAALRSFKERGVPSCLPPSIYILRSHPALTGSMSASRTIFYFILSKYLVSCANTMPVVVVKVKDLADLYIMAPAKKSSSKLCPKLCGDFPRIFRRCSSPHLLREGLGWMSQTERPRSLGSRFFFPCPPPLCAMGACLGRPHRPFPF